LEVTVRKVAVCPGRLCIDCGIDTIAIGEFYAVCDTVWARSGLGENDGMLCVGCLERRIGRKLRRADFIVCTREGEPWCGRSARYVDRLGRGRPAPAIIQALELNLAAATEPDLRGRLIVAINEITARRHA
jgi:hypothetical protein